MHHDKTTISEHNKPDMITFYNEPKFGVNVMVQSINMRRETLQPNNGCKVYSTMAYSIFFAMLNITRVNSKIVYDALNGST